MRIPFFRIFYSTTFTALGFILALILLITPGHLIYEAFRHRLIFHIFITAGVYILTFVVAVLLYASRLYANRRALIHIPKEWSPIEKDDLEKKVRHLIAEKLKESAAIAYKSRPRDLNNDNVQAPTDKGQQANVQIIRPHAPGIQPPFEKLPPWGLISHPGWSSPSSPDLPNLQFDPVVRELVNLIEAKAVSLAPPDPLYDPTAPTLDAPEPPLPDALIVELLQRPAGMGLRDYFAHLHSLGIIQQSSLTSSFLALYEHARFSGIALEEKEFRSLMAMFADILRGLKELDPDLVAQLRADNESLFSAEDAEVDGAAEVKSLDSNDTVQHTPRPDMYYTPRPDTVSISSGSEAGSEGSARTAPSHQGSRRNTSKTSRSPSARQQQQQRMVARSSNSLRLMKSHSSSLRSQGSGGSVIRLAEARTPLDLPYTIVTSSQEGL
ncbi:MAG: hypothetical protein Q9207_005211 [Kuettlingeria erythrocarpa]